MRGCFAMTIVAVAMAMGPVAGTRALADAPPGGQVPVEITSLPGAVAPFVTTPMSVVDEMLQLAKVGPSDVVVDLGSGDGRLVLVAVTKFGAHRGFGVDIDASLVDYANRKAAEAGVSERAKFYLRDLFATDLRDATVVTVYLLPGIMDRLQKKLLSELTPGTRVVSHDYIFPSWPADRVLSLDVPDKTDYTGRRHTAVYLYSVPARSAATR